MLPWFKRTAFPPVLTLDGLPSIELCKAGFARSQFPETPFQVSRWRGGRYAFPSITLDDCPDDACFAEQIRCTIISVLHSPQPARWNSRQEAVRKYQNSIENP